MALDLLVRLLATRSGQEAKSLRSLLNGNVSTLNALTTSAKSDLVVAINEVRSLALTSSGSIDPSTSFTETSDFLNGVTGSTLTSTATGTGANISALAGELGRPGIARLTTGTTNTGAVGVRSGAGPFRLGGGVLSCEWAIRVPVLTTTTETFIWWAGFTDATNGIETDAIFFRGGTAGGLVEPSASNNGSRATILANSFTVTANTWIKLRVDINADASLASFYVNGVLNSTLVGANLPTLVGRETSVGAGILKSVGGTARTLDLDYFKVTQTFTTAR